MVVDFSATDVAPPVRAVEAVALGQKVLDACPAALGRFPHGAVAGRELRRRRAPVRPQAPVVDLVARGMRRTSRRRSKAGGMWRGRGGRLRGLPASREKNQMPGLPSAVT